LYPKFEFSIPTGCLHPRQLSRRMNRSLAKRSL